MISAFQPTQTEVDKWMSSTDDEAKSVRQHTHINLSNVAACASQVLCALPHTCVIVPREATACFDIGIESSPLPLAPLRNSAQMKRLI